MPDVRHLFPDLELDVYAGLFADDLDSVAMALDALVPSQRSTSGSTGPSAPAPPSETPG